MNRLRFSLLAAICLIVPPSVVWSAPVPAARSGLEQVPDTAPLVVHLRGVQGTRDRLVAMMQNALPDVLKKFQKEMDDFVQNGYDGHKYRGLAKDGPIFVVVTELPKAGQPLNGPPQFAFIVAVSNYKEFRDNFLNEEERKGLKHRDDGIDEATFMSEPIYFSDRKGYAVITPKEEVAKSFTKKFTGLHAKMSKEQAAKLLAADLGVYVNMEAINKEYGEEIKKAKDGIEQLLSLAAGSADEAQKQSVELVKKALGPIFQAIEDMQAILLSVEMRPGGLALHLQSEMKEGTPTATLLQDSRPAAFPELDRMPRDRAFYVGMNTSAAFYKHLGALVANFQPEGNKEISAAMMEELAKAGPGISLMGGSFPMTWLAVSHYDDPAKAVESSLKMYQKMEPKTSSLKGKPTIKKDAEKYGDIKLHFVQIEWDIDKIAEQAAAKGGGDAAKKAAAASMKGVWGEKMTMWLGTDGKKVLQIVAPDWPTGKKLLDQYSKGTGTVGEVKAFRDVRNEMPKQTSLLTLVDAVNLFGSILEVVKPIIPGGQFPPGWPNMAAKGPVAYFGVAATLQPGRGSFDWFISAGAARAFYNVVVKPLVGE